MREWTVAGGLILAEAGLLLVRNRRRDGSHDWSPPGGVIEPGESTVDGLTREVQEETGVEVLDWRGPVYEVRVEAPDMGWRARVEAHVAEVYQGELRVDDPDGIVVDLGWFDPSSCEAQLQSGHPWVREPLVTWLAAGAAEDSDAWSPRTFRYHVAGSSPATAVVTAL